jgi:capsular polysaccharide biosynthesis protein
MNKKQKEIIKKIIFSFLNIFKKKYIVSHVHLAPNRTEIIENAKLKIENHQSEYLKYQKLFPYSETEINRVDSVDIQYYENVYVDLENGIALNNDLKIIQESKKYSSINVGTYLEKIKKYKVIEDECIVVINGALNAQYFHIWFDSLIKLYYLSQFKSIKPTIVLIDKVPKIYRDVIYTFNDTFKIIEVSERFIKVKEYIIIKNLYWSKHAPYFTPRMRDFFVQKLLSDNQTEKTFPDKIYIARKTRPIQNSIEIEKIFANNGYHIVFLEDLTIFEQAKLFNSATIIAGLHGAGFTNLIFASSKLKVLELQNYAVVPTYYFISQQLGLDYYYLLPKEYNFDLIKDPYTESRLFYKQKLTEISFDTIKLLQILEKIK